MTEKEAREIVEQWRSQGKGIPSPYAILVPNEKYAQAKGYLEAIEKAKVLGEALRKIQNHVKYSIPPTFSVRFAPTWKIAEEALAKWEEEK